MVTGLRRRLDRALRRVEDQHRALGEIADELDRAIATSARTDTERWLGRFYDALIQHFELEEDVIFPALHGLLPAVQPKLVRLEREHGEYLGRLRVLIERGMPFDGHQTLIDALGELRLSLRAHEALEESIIEEALASRPSRGPAPEGRRGP